MTTPDGPKSGAATATRFAPGPRWRFVEAFLREPLSVGSLWPSSTELSWAVVDGCDFDSGATVVELGPGTGAFTGLAFGAAPLVRVPVRGVTEPGAAC